MISIHLCAYIANKIILFEVYEIGHHPQREDI